MTTTSPMKKLPRCLRWVHDPRAYVIPFGQADGFKHQQSPTSSSSNLSAVHGDDDAYGSDEFEEELTPQHSQSAPRIVTSPMPSQVRSHLLFLCPTKCIQKSTGSKAPESAVSQGQVLPTWDEMQDTLMVCVEKFQGISLRHVSCAARWSVPDAH